ncbi:hypothetical protein [Gluconobacter albidus]|uniref:hypothetical protein n=1 Tax=Gluconobacter albidus TaxID=318683 RepID=UPI001B8D2898|nr:hypothetical protein [Gluconobacter albidus]MBS1029423.1 hypothetical protein [Gluconobacter albidus]
MTENDKTILITQRERRRGVISLSAIITSLFVTSSSAVLAAYSITNKEFFRATDEKFIDFIYRSNAITVILVIFSVISLFYLFIIFYRTHEEEDVRVMIKGHDDEEKISLDISKPESIEKQIEMLRAILVERNQGHATHKNQPTDS